MKFLMIFSKQNLEMCVDVKGDVATSNFHILYSTKTEWFLQRSTISITSKKFWFINDETELK